MFTNTFDPVAFEIFSLSIRWYSLAYIFGIIFGWLYCKKILIKDNIIKEFLRRGGLRCQILSSSSIKIGDQINILD